MDQIDVRGWAHRFSKEDGCDFVKTRRGEYILSVLKPLVGVSQEVKCEYWNWTEEEVLAPIKEQYPDLYLDFVEWYRRLIANTADMDITKGETT